AITVGVSGNTQDITFETKNFDVNSTGAVTIDGTDFTYTPTGMYTVTSGGAYTIDATGAVTIDSDAASTLSGAGVNLTSDGANAITLTYAATGGTFQLTDGTTRMEVADNGDLILGDDGATTTIDGSTITLSGNTLFVGTITQTLTDATTNALDIQEGTNNYININTSDGAEAIQFGNAVTNPTYNFLGTGLTSFGGNIDMQTNLILNIGNAGTDFTSSGGLNLAGNIDVNGTTNDIAGTLNLSGGALTSTGAMTITPAAGNNLNIALSTTGDFAVNTDDLYVDTSSGFVGIGTTAPGSALDVKGTLRLSGSTSGYVGLAPAANAGSITYTLPSADGGSGQVLATNGGAILSWSPVNWTASGNDLYNNNSGNDGIGTTSPASLFSVGATSQFQVNSTGAIVASAGITSTGNATLSTAINSTNTFGSGASSINTIGSATTPGALTLLGSTIVAGGANTTAITLGNVTTNPTFTLLGTGLTTLGGNLTVTGTAWTATPTISGLITATSGLTATTGNITATLGNVAITAGLLSLNGVTRIDNTGVGTFITGTVIGTQTFTTNNIADSGALTIASGTASALTLNSGTTGTINIGTDASAEIINIGNTGAAAKTIYIGNNATAGTVTTIGSATNTGLVLSDAQWSVTDAGVANFVSVGTGTAGTGAFTTLSATGLSITSANTTQVTTASALALNVNSLTTGTGFYTASSSLSSGSLFDLAITGTAGLTNQKGLNVSLSGANATPAQTTYGAYLSNAHTGTSNNVGLYATATGGTNNYAAIFESGNVGIGTTSPSAMLSLYGTTNALRLSYDATNYSTLSADSTGQLQIKGASVYDASLTLGSNAANNVAIIFDDNSTAGDFYAGVDNDASGKFKIGLLSHDAFLTINTTG
ncbi:MAG: hypothetical protein Q8P23_04035, partial [bacterium]|nr:hypothetical protein [bacterium]